jgi:predicted MFS family arabinose efflux permease
MLLLPRALSAEGRNVIVLTIRIDIAAPSNVAVLRSYVNVASTLGLSLGGPLGGFLGGTIGWRW